MNFLLLSLLAITHALNILDNQEWQCLGPFLSGTRELGYDPLSAFGGFESLSYSKDSCYPSEVADFGCVKWFKVVSSGQVQAVINNVDWEYNRKFFGWSIYQVVVYLKTEFKIVNQGYYTVKLDNVYHFKIDDVVYAANGLNTTTSVPNIVFLSAGVHALYTSQVYDLRKSGGNEPPKVSFFGEILPIDSSNSNILLFPDQDIIPQVMDGKLITNYASITFMNGNFGELGRDIVDSPHQHSFFHKIYDPGWVHLVDVYAESDTGINIPTSNALGYSVKVAPGQVSSVGVELLSLVIKPSPKGLRFTLEFYFISSKERFTVKTKLYDLVERVWNEPYKMTFVDYDRTVQYAMVRPPRNVSCVRSESVACPILVALHGAGVEASSSLWLDAYRQQTFAWILFPSGRTPWGHDWHGASHLNVKSALENMIKMPGVPDQYIDGIKPDLGRIIYTGHSNGGQGAWWMASHFPDEVLAAIPVSAFVNIHFYAPYYMGMGNSFSDPSLRAMLESSISEHDIDLYVSNLAGIPILARTGALDDNVPAVHTRRLVRLVHEWNRNPTSITYDEVPGKGHWFEGILSDDLVQKFLDNILDRETNPNLELPPFPDAFTLTTMNPFSTGTKGGIRILQLEVPFRIAKIRVIRKDDKWLLLTSNVRRLGFEHDPRQKEIKSFSIDDTDFDYSPLKAGPSYLKVGKLWEEAPDLLWISKERHPDTYGPAIHILNHPFVIVVPSHKYDNITIYQHIAQQIALSWYMCCKGITQIIKDVDLLDGFAAQYNLIVLGGPIDNVYTRRREREGSSVMFQYLPSGGVKIDSKSYERPGTGAIFLAPSPTRTRTGLFISGVDTMGLQRAAWIIPFRTGLTIPDYMVVGDDFGDPNTGWSTGSGGNYWGAGTKGAGGIYAAGYWSNTWEFDGRCGYVK